MLPQGMSLPPQIAPMGPMPTPILPKNMPSGCGYAAALPKLPPIQSSMNPGAVYNLGDMRRDGYPEMEQSHNQAKNMRAGNGYYDHYAHLPPQSVLTNQLIQSQVGMSHPELINSLKGLPMN